MKTLTYQRRRYTIVFETENDVVVNLHSDEIYGHCSRMSISKQKLNRFWRNRIGKISGLNT